MKPVFTTRPTPAVTADAGGFQSDPRCLRASQYRGLRCVSPVSRKTAIAPASLVDGDSERNAAGSIEKAELAGTTGEQLATCLEYILVHEVVHLLERHYNDRFKNYMDQFTPQWPSHRNELNRAPLAHEESDYYTR